MTREEAMDIFEHNWTKLVNPDYTEEELNKAIGMAIKALEQEPCDDAISRQAVLDGIEELKKSPWATDKRGNGFEYLITEALDVVAELCIKREPPVNPQEPLTDVLDKIKAEIKDCLKALDEIEKSGFNIYHPDEMSGRRLTYKQCLGFIDKYRGEKK